MPKNSRIKIKDDLYRPTKGVKWIVELDGILIVNPKAKTSLKLNQTESSLWQLTTAQTPQNQLSRFLTALKGITLTEAEKFIQEVFDRWRELKYLEYRSGK
jgi:hypothetical protein